MSLETLAGDPSFWLLASMLFLIALYVVYSITRSTYKVQADEVALVERLGRYQTTLRPGVRFIVPFIDRVAYLVRTDEQVTTVLVSDLTTQDGTPLEDVEVLMNFQIQDAAKSTYVEVDYLASLHEQVRSSLQELISLRPVQKVGLEHRRLQEDLQASLAPFSDKVGVNVTNVYIPDLVRV